MDYNAMYKLVKAQNPSMPYREQQKKASEMLAEFKKAQVAHATNDVNFTSEPPAPDIKTDELAPGESPELPQAGYDAAAESMLRVSAEPVPRLSPQLKRVSITNLVALEKRIREAGVNRNNIISIARPIIPGGELVKHEKDGVNTLVTFEDQNGNKVPVYGYFKIYI